MTARTRPVPRLASRLRAALLPLLIAGLAACGDDAPATGAADAADTSVADTSPPEDASATDVLDATSDAADTDGIGPAPDPTDLMYARDHVLEVVITMDPADEAAMRAQARELLDVIGPGCLDAPAPDPFTWFRADITVDGVTRTDVGVRKKGFLGSLDPVRPSLKVKFDEFRDGNTLDGLQRMTLNNGRQDPSRLNQCLAYDTFARAGVPAPRCNFAHVTLNGADLGLYVHVESLKEPFLRRHFGYDGGGELWEGALSDFRDGWLGSFEQKTHESRPTRVALERVVAALRADDTQLLDALADVLDLDLFFRLWATEVAIGHWDGYAGNRNNFYAYYDPTDRLLKLLPWGADATFGAGGEDREEPPSILAHGVLAHRLYAHPEGRARYHAALRAVLADAFDREALLDAVDAWQPLVAAARLPDQAPLGTADLARVRAFIAGRRAALEADIADGGPDWPFPLSDAPCITSVGGIAGSLDTSWGTLDVDLFVAGSGTLAVAPAEGEAPTFDLYGARAGDNPDDPDVATFQLAARMPDGDFLVVAFDVPRSSVATDVSVPLDLQTGLGYLARFHPPEEFTLLAYIVDGVLSFEAAGRTPGAPIQASFEASLWAF